MDIFFYRAELEGIQVYALFLSYYFLSGGKKETKKQPQIYLPLMHA